MADGTNSGLSRREVLNEYHLESSANVQSVKKALIVRDFIDVDNGVIYFCKSPNKRVEVEGTLYFLFVLHAQYLYRFRFLLNLIEHRVYLQERSMSFSP